MEAARVERRLAAILPADVLGYPRPTSATSISVGKAERLAAAVHA